MKNILPPVKIKNERFLIVQLIPVQGIRGFECVVCDSRPDLKSARNLCQHLDDLRANHNIPNPQCRFGVVEFLGHIPDGKWKATKKE